ncbi:hypothetical protein Ctob_005888 [Chrysochromulina tobinii]|uniref:Uncharacterized protein n=1 Tax=Chrysochromulina tobinii TaxID=1460289 RepID=A0A0M0JVX5_9EUKA|nr:hypothetical protein Ctob_005888 [Chrysochromulina tobinii]|eukprot:KOO30710.1 hypothetical protein Ctob_005888 [Chrysochromulina sp. CCMP291]
MVGRCSLQRGGCRTATEACAQQLHQAGERAPARERANEDLDRHLHARNLQERAARDEDEHDREDLLHGVEVVRDGREHKIDGAQPEERGGLRADE